MKSKERRYKVGIVIEIYVVDNDDWNMLVEKIVSFVLLILHVEIIDENVALLGLT